MANLQHGVISKRNMLPRTKQCQMQNAMTVLDSKRQIRAVNDGYQIAVYNSTRTCTVSHKITTLVFLQHSVYGMHYKL